MPSSSWLLAIKFCGAFTAAAAVRSMYTFRPHLTPVVPQKYACVLLVRSLSVIKLIANELRIGASARNNGDLGVVIIFSMQFYLLRNHHQNVFPFLRVATYTWNPRNIECGQITCFVSLYMHEWRMSLHYILIMCLCSFCHQQWTNSYTKANRTEA